MEMTRSHGDDETGMNEVVRGGGRCASSKLTASCRPHDPNSSHPLAYGTTKLQIGCVTVGEKISVDWLIETIHI